MRIWRKGYATRSLLAGAFRARAGAFRGHNENPARDGPGSDQRGFAVRSEHGAAVVLGSQDPKVPAEVNRCTSRASFPAATSRSRPRPAPALPPSAKIP
jgi:hypothetical protein